MINLLDNNLDIKALFKQESAFLCDYLESQQKLNYKLHIRIREIVNSQVISSLKQSEELYENLSLSTKMLISSNENLCHLNILKDSLSSVNLDNNDYENTIETYNDLYLKYFDTIVKNTSELEKYLDSSKSNIENAQDTHSMENTLLISEVDNKVVLPFTLEELNKFFSSEPDKYKTLSDVINKVYTKPLTYYKYSSLCRFKEAYKLIREREKGSFMQAMDLALELFSNYNLHPAIISACKNLNELDVYLSCLEYNELNDFHFFKTIFKMHPTISTNAVKI